MSTIERTNTKEYKPGDLTRATAEWWGNVATAPMISALETQRRFAEIARRNRDLGRQAYERATAAALDTVVDLTDYRKFTQWTLEPRHTDPDVHSVTEYAALRDTDQHFTLEDGRDVSIHTPTDDEREQMYELYRSMSDKDMDTRFFGRVSDESLHKAAYAGAEDPEHIHDLVASIDGNVVAIAGYTSFDGVSEPHILVGETARGMHSADGDHPSIAKELMARNLRMESCDPTVDEIIVDVRTYNTPMNKLLKYAVEQNNDVVAVTGAEVDGSVRETFMKPTVEVEE